MTQFSTILWQEMILFRRKFWGITTGSMVSPVLYLIVFGWGLGGVINIGGTPYIQFVIPGIIALTTMNLSFSTVANDINISRMYTRTFEEFMTSPVNMPVFAAGKICAGALRGLYSASIIILLALLVGSGLQVNGYFLMIMILNCLVFSALGLIAGLVIDSHGDMYKFTNFIIAPMSFLCGTFFPVDRMPPGIREFIWTLPLTQTSLGLRASDISLQQGLPPLILLTYLAVFGFIGIRLCKNAE